MMKLKNYMKIRKIFWITVSNKIILPNVFKNKSICNQIKPKKILSKI